MKSMFKTALLVLVFCFSITSYLTAKEITLTSPSKQLVLKISVTDVIKYSLNFNDSIILAPSQISLTLDANKVLGLNVKLMDEKRRSVNEILKPLVRQKFENIRDNFNELTLSFEGDYSLIFRAYNDGMAYRFRTIFPSEIIIKSEQVEFNFAKDYELLFPEEDGFMSHSERMYKMVKLSEISSTRFCSLPMLVKLDNNVKAIITEADLEDYCGMYLTGSENPHNLTGLFPYYPSKDSVIKGRNIYVTEREDFMAKTNGRRYFPWRVVVISENDADLLLNTTIYKLAKPADPKMDFSWVKPGKVAWDWWNYNNVYGVDFRAGINTETYKYYIDFASKSGIEYVILDEGWYKLGNLLEQNPDINVPELIDYGRKKNVGIILWVVWKTLDDQLKPALDLFVIWGVKGIKVDFMQRDDQPIVQYYYRVANEAAKRKLLVDFHGSYKPTGLYRTFPNVLTSEGVKGLENSKWSEEASPWMAVTLPFIRMLAGPMDYTPGAMQNATKNAFKAVYTNPMSQGTRCHQLAMYVNFESPLQMLADNPTHYYNEPECMEFLSKVPVEWDDTKVLDAKVSEYIITARRHGTDWFIGAMTNWTPRDMTIDFSFLPEGNYRLDLWQDGINADRNGRDYKKISRAVKRDTKLNIHLAPGGGWVGIVSN